MDLIQILIEDFTLKEDIYFWMNYPLGYKWQPSKEKIIKFVMLFP